MALNLNKVILAGRLTDDPVLKQSYSGTSIATFRLAVNRRYTAKKTGADNNATTADFFRVDSFGQTADFIGKYFHKGSPICIVGRIQNDIYTNQKGEKVTTTNIIAEEANFVESSGSSSASREAAPQETTVQEPANSSPATDTKPFEEVPTDDDLPF